jgi:hypothetical protein
VSSPPITQVPRVKPLLSQTGQLVCRYAAVGQTVRCTVRHLGKGKSGGKRIDLSLRLSVLCAGIGQAGLYRFNAVDP